ncbi:MAG: sugar phosphate isomerase/epimerase family protein [Aureliella sp.]
MYKNLSSDLLGITGRQSEIIELALTYGFNGIDIDIRDLCKRCERTSFESAARFLTSSKLNVGGFSAPIDLDADDETFAKELAQLHAAAEIAGRAQANVAILEVPCQTDRLPYPEYFDVIRKRIADVAAVFAKEEVKTAITFNPIKDGEKQFPFIQDTQGFVALATSCNDVGIVFDSWAWFCGKGTVEQLEQIGLERVFAARICDCVEGVSAEAATLDDCTLPATTGVIDAAPYLQKFVEANLEIPVSARGSLTITGGKRDAFIGTTQESLDKVFVEAGLPSSIRKPDMFSEPSYANNQ